MKKKILFCITNLIGGGAEKILLDTIKYMDKNKFDIDVFTLVNEGIYIKEIKKYANYKYAFDLNKYPSFCHKYLRFLFLRYIKFSKKEKLYKKYIKNKYDYEVSYLEGPSTKLIAGSSSKAMKFAWIHVDLLKLPDSRKYYRNSKEELDSYLTYDEIMCVSSDVKSSFIKIYPILENRTKILLNVLDTNKINSSISNTDFCKKDSRINLITIGRLSPQKGYDRLLRCCLKLKKDGCNFKLRIAGTGLSLNEFQKYIEDNDLQQYVELLGFVSNPYKLLAESDLFVCSSITEGFSTVVSEAIYLGIPVVTTDCAGMRDILGDSEYGLIIENSEDALYFALKDLIVNPDKIRELKFKAEKRKKFFDLNERLRDFEALFENGESK